MRLYCKTIYKTQNQKLAFKKEKNYKKNVFDVRSGATEKSSRARGSE